MGPIVSIRCYMLDISKADELKEYKGMCRVLSSVYEKFKVFSLNNDWRVPAGKYRIDTKILFSNQYNAVKVDGKDNTGEGIRIFDWYEDASPERYQSSMRIGFYIKPCTKGRKQLDEIKMNRFVCGYCGAQYDNPKIDFCTKCRSNEYLTPDCYKLLKLQCVADAGISSKSDFYSDVEIPDGVLADIKDKQKAATIQKIHTEFARRLDELERKKNNAFAETHLLKYLALRGFTDIGNMIFYTHTGEFCFGWRNPVSDETATLLHKLMPTYLRSHSTFTYKVIERSERSA